MVKESTLRHESSRVTSYIEKYVTLAGTGKKEEVLELFNNMHQVFPQWVIMTCPIMHPDIYYASKNAHLVLDYNSEKALNKSNEIFFPHVHDDDQQDLYECFRYMHNFFEAIPPREHHEYRATFNYRFRRSDGHNLYLHDEKAALRLGDSSNLYYALIRDISEEQTFGGVKLTLFKQEELMQKIGEYKPSGQDPLSKREKQLVTLIKQGLSGKEIAWQLNISHNTVRNIKSRMFEKLGVNNTIELLNKVA